MSVSITRDNIEYRGEGNAGLAIRLKKEEKVLRLTKQDNACKNRKSQDAVFKELEIQTEIVKNVMRLLVGSDLVHCPLVIFLQAEEIRMINNTVSRFRPDYRRHKSVKEEDTYVFMLPDYCSLPPSLKHYPSDGSVISIEIKPKQGFMKEEFQASSQTALPLLLCSFCRMQSYKMRKGVISVKSGYCPTDLFSGCHTRMFHALKMLLKAPQNNFRIFKDQKLMYSEEKKCDLEELLSDFFHTKGKIRYSDLLCNLVIQALLKSCFASQKTKHHSQVKAVKCCRNAHPSSLSNGLCPELPPGCVLDRILNVQKLDTLGIVDLYPLFLELREHFVQCFDMIGCFSRAEIPPYLGEPKKMMNETDNQYASRKVWEFLTALTMKDCSIMLVLKHISECYTACRSKDIISDDYGNLYLFSVAIIDLDTKSLCKIEKIYTETPFILKSCLD